jgi:uracil-DNA glycosylase
MTRGELELIAAAVVACRACPRLVAWRERTAREKVARFADEDYWGRPLPGFGDPAATVMVVGLAPAAHGGNRTGRIFTGDRSGDFLYVSMFRAGLSNQPTSVAPEDGLRLRSTYVAAVNRCAPPENKPTPLERDTCLPYLVREIEALDRLRVFVALGGFAWDGALAACRARGIVVRPKPKFTHGAEIEVGPYTLLGAFHPSQQNTFTGRLTQEMLDEVLGRAAELGGVSPAAGGASRPRRAREPGAAARSTRARGSGRSAPP